MPMSFTRPAVRRLSSGMLNTVVRSMNCPTDEVSDSRSGTVAFTSTDSVTAPTSMAKSSVLVVAVSSTTPERTAFLKPCNSMVTSYSAGGRNGKR